jgi:hypothetical protein
MNNGFFRQQRYTLGICCQESEKESVRPFLAQIIITENKIGFSGADSFFM